MCHVLFNFMCHVFYHMVVVVTFICVTFLCGIYKSGSYKFFCVGVTRVEVTSSFVWELQEWSQKVFIMELSL